MTEQQLIINKVTSRKPDYWLLSIGDYTDDELSEVAPAMKKLKIQLPKGKRA